MAWYQTRVVVRVSWLASLTKHYKYIYVAWWGRTRYRERSLLCVSHLSIRETQQMQRRYGSGGVTVIICISHAASHNIAHHSMANTMNCIKCVHCTQRFNANIINYPEAHAWANAMWILLKLTEWLFKHIKSFLNSLMRG